MTTVHERVTRASETITPKGIALLEKSRHAIYVFESCIGEATDKPGIWNWLNWPCAIFYQPNPILVPEGGTPYFGIYSRKLDEVTGDPGGSFICNAISCAEPFQGIVADNGDIIYSRYRHDMRTSPDESVWIDGGRDYSRYDPTKGTLIGLQMFKEYLYEVDLRFVKS